MMVLGWFICRDKVALVPSMRDKAVCAALPAALAQLQPAHVEPRYVHQQSGLCM